MSYKKYYVYVSKNLSGYYLDRREMYVGNSFRQAIKTVRKYKKIFAYVQLEIREVE